MSDQICRDIVLGVGTIAFFPPYVERCEFIVHQFSGDGVPGYRIHADTKMIIEGVVYHGGFRGSLGIVEWLRKSKKPMAYIKLHPERHEYVTEVCFVDEAQDDES